MRGGGGFGRFRRFAYSCACRQRCRLGSPACARALRFEAAACRRGRPRGRRNVASVAGRDSRRDSVVSYVRTILWKVGVARVFDDLHINEKSGVPVWVQIRNHLLFLIKSERIKPGDVLPTVRELAARLGVNYNTVHKVYQDLEADGLMSTARNWNSPNHRLIWSSRNWFGWRKRPASRRRTCFCVWKHASSRWDDELRLGRSDDRLQGCAAPVQGRHWSGELLANGRMERTWARTRANPKMKN